MKVTFTRRHLAHKAGETKDLPDAEAMYFLRTNVAVAAKHSPAKQPEKKIEKKIVPQKKVEKKTQKVKRSMDVSTKGLHIPVKSKKK